MKQTRKRDFLTVVLFFGILLSFTIYFGIGTLLSDRTPLNGVTEEEGRPIANFNSLFYEDEVLQNLIQFCELRIFQQVDDPDILIGNEDFLFEVYDEETQYNYLLDYVGGCPYTEEELTRLAEILAERRDAFTAMGTEYRFVVIPNSMTVCERYMPGFAGRQSDQTRLRQLRAYMESRGADYFLDPTDIMRADAESLGALYQNTEDAMNAYGAYSLYRTMAASVGCEDPLAFEEMDFVVHMTEGRKVAKLAGLQGTVENRTVSLTDAATSGYRVINEEHCLRGSMKDKAVGRNETLMICFSRSWDRVQMMPFFSNTYDTVYYHDGEATAEEVEKHAPKILIEVVRESELHLLLNSN